MEFRAAVPSRLCLLLPVALTLLALLVARPAWGTTEEFLEAPEVPEDLGFGLDTLKPARGIRQKVKLFVGIPSLHTKMEQRQAARDTWIGIVKSTQVGRSEEYPCLCAIWTKRHPNGQTGSLEFQPFHTHLEQRQAVQDTGTGMAKATQVDRLLPKSHPDTL